MNSVSTIDKERNTDTTENNTGFVFFLFCLWAFVVLCRPQDIFPILAPLRPALTMAVLTLGIVFIRYKDIAAPPFFRERQVKYYTALLAIMVLGIPFSLYARLSFMFVFTEYINVILFFFVFYMIVNSVKRLSMIILISCLGIGLYSAFALSEFVPGTGRLSFGGMFDPNDIAYFVLGFLPMNLIFISRENPVWIRTACLGCLGMGILLIFYSGSRAGLLAFGAASVLLLLSSSRTIRFSMKAAFVIMCLVFVSFSSIDTERYGTLLEIEDDYNIHHETGRLALWKIGARALLDNPITGVGVRNYAYAVGLDREARGAETLRWQTAHNSVIQIGTETGIVGLILFLLMSVNVLRILKQAKKTTSDERLMKISEMGIIGFVGLFVSGLFLSQAYSFYWAFYIALSASVSQIQIRESSS